jgi:subtilisin family serine protease
MWVATAVNNASIVFRWSDSMTTASTDLDIIAYNEDGTVCGTSENPQDGSDGSYPVEIIEAINCTSWVQVVVYSQRMEADLTGLEGYLYGTFGIDEDLWTNTEDLTLPGDIVGGITVGAWYPDTDQIAYYSSRGPTNDGRIKPDIVGPTGVSTETYGRQAFEGTSAATPHAAGVGALWIDATGGNPKELKEWMRANARDLGPAGEDNIYGMGALQASDIPSGACGGCSPLGVVSIPGLAGWIWVAGLRRKPARDSQ